MTLPLPFQVKDSETQNNFDEIAQHFPLHAKDFANDVLLLAVTGTQRKIAIGTKALTWTAATDSAVATVTHGLGTTPVGLGCLIDNGGVAQAWASTATIGATTFTLQGIARTAISATLTAYWIAVG